MIIIYLKKKNWEKKIMLMVINAEIYRMCPPCGPERKSIHRNTLYSQRNCGKLSIIQSNKEIYWNCVSTSMAYRLRAEIRNCVNREVGQGSHSPSHSAPVPDKPYCFCGHKVPWKKKGGCRSSGIVWTERWGRELTVPNATLSSPQ